MIEIREVKTKKEQKEFINFPINLYKNNPYFVPPLYMDEKQIFSPNYSYYDTCEAVYYNAYQDGIIVGRISGILQKASNEKNGEKRIRFTRFDSIDSVEVAKALFDAVENWGKSIGMDTICGPLGFSDLEREGLLIEGFDQLSTYEEQYNYDYYPKLLEACGYVKEVDWTESKLSMPDDYNGELEKLSEFVMKKNNLHFGECKNIGEFIKLYVDDMFSLIDKSYDKLYGTVPLTESTKKSLISTFKMVVTTKHVAVILNEENKVVCFGLCFPSIGEPIRDSKGHLTPRCIARILWRKKHAKVVDLGLVGVDPEYVNRGISSCMSAGIIHWLRDMGIEYAETNLNLEDNLLIQNQWKRFNRVNHKRRRSYVKTL